MGGLWTTRRRTITPADLTAFAGVAGDFNPLLVDEPYARSTTFGGTVVPGSMVAAVALGLGSLDVPMPATAGMVGMTWRYLKPVRPGDSLRARFRLNRKRAVENPRFGLAFWQIDVLNQDDEVVATGEVGRLINRCAQASPDGAAAPAASGTRRRRRRRSAAERTAEAAVEAVESAPLPEPAPADVPSPSRRRRRRRGGSGNGNGRRSEPAEPAPAEPAPVTGAASAVSAPAAPEGGLRGVLRRLRGS
ncbi:MAG TPA: MaoC family dehydratase [Candidatus Dormibacteraeota bacterium]